MTTPSDKPIISRQHSLSTRSVIGESMQQTHPPLFSLIEQPLPHFASDHPKKETFLEYIKRIQQNLAGNSSESDEDQFVTPSGSLHSSSSISHNTLVCHGDRNKPVEMPRMRNMLLEIRPKAQIVSPKGVPTGIDTPAAKAIVVGAGLSGLTIAHLLKNQGVEPVIFDSSPRVGGRIYSIQGGVLSTDSETVVTVPSSLGVDTKRQVVHKAQNGDCRAKDKSVSNIDIGFHTIHAENRNLLNLVSSLGLQVHPVGSGALLVQSGKKTKLFSSSIVRDGQVSPIGGMSAVIDRLSMNVDIRTSHKLVYLSWIEGRWQLLFHQQGSDAGYSILTKLLFIAIPPRQFAKVKHDGVSLPPSLPSLLQRFPTQYVNRIQFVAHYTKEFWSSSHGKYAPVSYCPQGPVVEAHALANTKRGPFAIIGRIHPNFGIKFSGPDNTSTLNVSASKAVIIKHLQELFGPGAEAVQRVSFVDWCQSPHLCSEKDRSNFLELTIQKSHKESGLHSPDYAELSDQLNKISHMLAFRGLFFSFPDTDPLNPGSGEQAVVLAKRAVTNAKGFLFSMKNQRKS